MLDHAVPLQRAGLPLARADESVGALGHAAGASGALTRTASLRRSRASQRRLLSPAVCSTAAAGWSVASFVALAAGGPRSSPAPHRRRLRELRRDGHAIACSTRHQDRLSGLPVEPVARELVANAAGAISFFLPRRQNSTKTKLVATLSTSFSLLWWSGTTGRQGSRLRLVKFVR